MDATEFRPEDYTIDPSAPPLKLVVLLTGWRTVDENGHPCNPAPGAYVRGTIVGDHPDHAEGTRITVGPVERWTGPIVHSVDGWHCYHLDNNPSQIHLTHLGTEAVTAEEPLGPMPGQSFDAVEQ